MGVIARPRAIFTLTEVGLDPDLDGKITLNSGAIKLRSSGIVYDLTSVEKYVELSSDVVVNNSVVGVEVTEFNIPHSGFSANDETYYIEYHLHLLGNTTADVKIEVKTSAGGNVSLHYIGNDAAASLGFSGANPLPIGIESSRSLVTCLVTVESGGTITLEFAQNVADPSNTTLNSFKKATSMTYARVS